MPATSRRGNLADAAITVLADSGGRGLTHRAVDRAAGVAEGSTSYYFRTRDSLLRAVVERLAALDTATFPDPTRPGRPGLVDDLSKLIEQVTTTGRLRLLARYELTLESTRRPELAQVLRTNGAAVRRALADRLLAAELAQVTDPEQTAGELLALLDGILLNRVTGVGAPQLDSDDLRERVDRLLAAAGA
jgi:DNA-binding transcriptional regulator YbjK